MQESLKKVVAARQTLLVMRMVWATLLVGQLIFLAIIPVVWAGGQLEPDPELGVQLFSINVGMTVVAIGLAFFVRNQAYKRGWQGDAITPGAYMAGNMLFLALLEGMSLFGLVATLVNGSFWPTIIPSAVCVALQAVNFPSGRAMAGDQFKALRDMGRQPQR